MGDGVHVIPTGFNSEQIRQTQRIIQIHRLAHYE